MTSTSANRRVFNINYYNIALSSNTYVRQNVFKPVFKLNPGL